jgi:hypothetical protein
MFKLIWNNLVTKRAKARKAKKIVEAFKTIESLGLLVFKVVNIGGTDYIVDNDGTMRKLSRKP